jgi:hypothetical protein
LSKKIKELGVFITITSEQNPRANIPKEQISAKVPQRLGVA